MTNFDDTKSLELNQLSLFYMFKRALREIYTRLKNKFDFDVVDVYISRTGEENALDAINNKCESIRDEIIAEVHILQAGYFNSINKYKIDEFHVRCIYETLSESLDLDWATFGTPQAIDDMKIATDKYMKLVADKLM